MRTQWKRKTCKQGSCELSTTFELNSSTNLERDVSRLSGNEKNGVFGIKTAFHVRRLPDSCLEHFQGSSVDVDAIPDVSLDNYHHDKDKARQRIAMMTNLGLMVYKQKTKTTAIHLWPFLHFLLFHFPCRNKVDNKF